MFLSVGKIGQFCLLLWTKLSVKCVCRNTVQFLPLFLHDFVQAQTDVLKLCLRKDQSVHN